jgi:hypothetical protein
VAASSEFQLTFIGPHDRNIDTLVADAFASEEIVATRGKGVTLLESAEPPIHIIVNLTQTQIEQLTAGTLTIAFASSVAVELGKDAYAVAKSALRAIARAIERAYKRIKDAKRRETYFSLRVEREGDRTLTYNLPGVDQEEALARIVDDVIEGDRSAADGDLFWNYGRWIDYSEYEILRDELVPGDEAGAIPTLEFLAATEVWTSIVGRAATFSVLANQRDIVIEVPPGLDLETRKRAIDAMRIALPNSVIGPTPTRDGLFVSDAASLP